MTLRNLSGQIVTGGQARHIEGAKARVYLLIQNISAGDLWVDFGQGAVQDIPSIKILPDKALIFEGGLAPGQSISIVGATTGQKFVCKTA